MYPGNHTESDMLYVPRNLKTRPGAPETHLAYITDDEAEMLQQYKPGTPHKGPEEIPNYDSWDYGGFTPGTSWSAWETKDTTSTGRADQRGVRDYERRRDVVADLYQQNTPEADKQLQDILSFGDSYTLPMDNVLSTGHQAMKEGVFEDIYGTGFQSYMDHYPTFDLSKITGGGGGGGGGSRGHGWGSGRSFVGGHGGRPPIEQALLGDPYREQPWSTNPMQQWMVDTHSPMYAARGGIMNLRR